MLLYKSCRFSSFFLIVTSFSGQFQMTYLQVKRFFLLLDQVCCWNTLLYFFLLHSLNSLAARFLFGCFFLWFSSLCWISHVYCELFSWFHQIIYIFLCLIEFPKDHYFGFFYPNNLLISFSLGSVGRLLCYFSGVIFLYPFLILLSLHWRLCIWWKNRLFQTS